MRGESQALTMAKRGEYTSIHTALADDPGFLELSPTAKLIVYTLKLILGPSGIDVVRRLEVQLEALTGSPAIAIREAIQELTPHWIQVEGSVVWLRNGLWFNPNLSLDNAKHRASVVNHAKGLPPLKIVASFAEYYDLKEIAIPMASDSHSIGYAKQVVGTRYTVEEQIPDANASGAEPPEELSTPKATEPEPAAEPDDEDDDTAPTFATLRGEIAQAVRTHLWQGKDPPPGMLARNPGWNMGRELSIAEQWAKDYGPEKALGVIEILPVVWQNEGHELVPLTLATFHAKRGREMLNMALASWDRRQVAGASKKVASILARLPRAG